MFELNNVTFSEWKYTSQTAEVNVAVWLTWTATRQCLYSPITCIPVDLCHRVCLHNLTGRTHSQLFSPTGVRQKTISPHLSHPTCHKSKLKFDWFHWFGGLFINQSIWSTPRHLHVHYICMDPFQAHFSTAHLDVSISVRHRGSRFKLCSFHKPTCVCCYSGFLCSEALFVSVLFPK